MRQPTRTRQRRGTVLAYFAVLVFALMALAALVIDVGFLRVTQRQMQSGVDTAALEGLRFRDDASFLAPAVGVSNDQARRMAASNLMAWRFDDDLNPANGDPFQVGAGPVLTFSGGVGLANALQLVMVPAVSVYKPTLQTNQTNNLTNGDMVGGTFIVDSPTGSFLEDPQYNRTDFTPSSAGAAAPSFLVRLRRTDNRNDSLNVSSGVSSRGPSMPLLFASGSVIQATDPSLGYAPRFHGFTVRATAIADARPAKTIGPAYPVSLYPGTAFAGFPGAAPFALTTTYWGSLTTDTLSVAAGGQLMTTNVGPAGPVGTTVGQMVRIASLTTAIGAADTTLTVSSTTTGFPPLPPFSVRIDSELMQVTAINNTNTSWSVTRGLQATMAAPHVANAPVLLHARLTLGPSVLTAAGGIASPQPTRLDLLAELQTGAAVSFVPLYLSDSVNNFVTGFGKVQWSVNANTGAITLTKQARAVAPQNATATFLPPLTLSPAQLGQVLTTHASLTNPILVPALAR